MYFDKTLATLPPLAESTGAGYTSYERVVSAGGTAETTKKLPLNKIAWIMTGATAVRINLVASAAGDAATASSFRIPPNFLFPWLVTENSRIVKAIDDGAGYEFFVWTGGK